MEQFADIIAIPGRDVLVHTYLLPSADITVHYSHGNAILHNASTSNITNLSY